MPSKEKILSEIPNVAHSGAQVKHLISSISFIEDNAPTVLKKGDCVLQQCGPKSRPVILVKILKDIVVGIPLSTTKDELTLCISNSRFRRDGYFTNQITTMSKEYAKKFFIGTYDNNKALNNAIREMKQFLIKAL